MQGKIIRDSVAGIPPVCPSVEVSNGPEKVTRRWPTAPEAVS